MARDADYTTQDADGRGRSDRPSLAPR